MLPDKVNINEDRQHSSNSGCRSAWVSIFHAGRPFDMYVSSCWVRHMLLSTWCGPASWPLQRRLQSKLTWVVAQTITERWHDSWNLNHGPWRFGREMALVVLSQLSLYYLLPSANWQTAMTDQPQIAWWVKFLTYMWPTPSSCKASKVATSSDLSPCVINIFDCLGYCAKSP